MGGGRLNAAARDQQESGRTGFRNETEVRVKMDKGVRLKYSHAQDTRIQAVSTREAE